MPTLDVENSYSSAAQYEPSAHQIHYNYKIYDIPAALGPEDKLKLGVDEVLILRLADGTELELEPKTPEEADAYHEAHRRKLRPLRQKHAKKAFMLLKIIQKAAKALVKIEATLNKEAAAIAGEYYGNYHAVSLETEGSNESQMNGDGYITTPDFVSVLKMADTTVAALEPVVLAAEPPPLPLED